MSNYGTFGENNPVWKAINRYADMLLTGVLFVITCLPVVTIGASLCAFYYTAMDSLRKEDGYIFKRYFSSFGKNFKKATILWLIMLTGCIFLACEFTGSVLGSHAWNQRDSLLSLVYDLYVCISVTDAL